MSSFLESKLGWIICMKFSTRGSTSCLLTGAECGKGLFFFWFMPENFLEINRYFALTSSCNTIGQSNNAFSIFRGKTKRLCFDHFIHWLIKQQTNTYRNHFSRTHENRSKAPFIRRNVPQVDGSPAWVSQLFIHFFNL